MPEYGPRMRVALIALGSIAAVTLTSCGVLNTDAAPSKIVIPGTDALLTESAAPSLAPTSASVTGKADEPTSPWSMARVIRAAPRSSNSQFQVGSTSVSGEVSAASGYHFSTEDRSIRCSTGNNGANALVCVSEKIDGARQRPVDAPEKCDWARDYAVVDANGPKEGACTNSYPVLFRSTILPAGNSIVVDRFACLADSSDLYCIESSSGTGFAITSDGYSNIRGDERAPKSLLGLSPATSTSAR